MTGAAAAPLVPRGLIPGVVIVLIGLVFLADSLGMLDAASGWALWPLAVIVAGVAVRLQPGVTNQVFGIVLIVAGVWLLFNEIGIWTYAFWRTWPLILILLGALIRYQSWRFQRPADNGQFGAVVFLSQVTGQASPGGPDTTRTTDMRSGELSAMVGDGLFDFGNAIRGADPIVVDVLAIAGRIRVAVPVEWNVGMRVLALPGRVADTRSSGATDAVGRNVDLIVQGTAMLGIVEIVTSIGAPAPAPSTH
jgi:hypothetical protein